MSWPRGEEWLNVVAEYGPLTLAGVLVILFALMLLAGCSGLKVEGDCTYTREVTVSYHCQPGSKVEHYRVSPSEGP